MAASGEDTVVGVDPGIARTGYGVVRRRAGAKLDLLECGVIRVRAGGGLAERLREIFEGIGDVLARHDSNSLALEAAFFGRNARTALVLGHARGAIMLAAALRGLPVHEYSPAEVKSAVVGAGRATKEQVQYMIQNLLRLKSPPQPSDAADGVAVALCHCFNHLTFASEPQRGLSPAALR